MLKKFGIQLPAGLIRRVKDRARARSKKEGRVSPSQVVQEALEQQLCKRRKKQ